MHVPSINISSARTKLALTYLAIIMILSLGFSTVFYYQSINEARYGFRRQENQLREFLYFTTPEGVQKIRDIQLSAFKLNLQRRLVALNLGMLVVGGALSFYLAKRSLRPLEETIESQNRFASDAAHELRTPLTAMKTEIEVTLRDKNLKVAEAKDVLASSLEEINKLESLSGALLRLAKSTREVDKSMWQDYSLVDILKEAKARIDSKAISRKITFRLPKSQVTVHGDPDQLIELFVVLFDNAIKYSPERSKVDVKVTKRDDKVKVQVIDHGVGITEIDLPHIFDRFYRADKSRTSSNENGYGLGLSLAKQIVEIHCGEISAKSDFGKGSIFTVEIPSF